MATDNLPDFLDHYCERVAPGLWNEPFNLLSNLAFIIAGVLAWRLLMRNRNQIAGRIWDMELLSLLLFAIGVGSGLWHMFANQWSLMTDSIPILLFINLYLLSCLFRIFSLPVTIGITIFIFYHIINYSIQSALPGDFLNGSIFYLPTWGFLLGITIAAWKQKAVASRHYVNALIIFTVSLIFRTVDQAVCEAIPAGTHFVWHLLNAATIYLLMYGLIYNTAVHISRPR
jgi:hypothetical protein